MQSGHEKFHISSSTFLVWVTVYIIKHTLKDRTKTVEEKTKTYVTNSLKYTVPDRHWKYKKITCKNIYKNIIMHAQYRWTKVCLFQANKTFATSVTVWEMPIISLGYQMASGWSMLAQSMVLNALSAVLVSTEKAIRRKKEKFNSNIIQRSKETDHYQEQGTAHRDTPANCQYLNTKHVKSYFSDPSTFSKQMKRVHFGHRLKLYILKAQRILMFE